MLNNPFRADLHAHTTASDGALSPRALVLRAREIDLSVLALTDHDTLSGVAQAQTAAHECGLTILTGVELSAGDDGETHVLGYGQDPDSPPLRALFLRMQAERVDRAREIAQKLSALGLPIPIDDMLERATGSVGRPHIARALIALGYVQTMEEAFDRLLGSRCPAYVPRKPLPVTKAIETLQSARFVPVLAHPGLMNMPQTTFLSLLSAWKSAGLMGLECWHPSNDRERGCVWYDQLARAQGLLVTGGSDYHDDAEGHAPLGAMANLWINAKQDTERLMKAISIT